MNPQVEPKPSWLLILTSILVIAGCIVATSGVLTSLYMTDIFFKALALLTAIPPMKMGISQYCGTFRRHAGAAHAAAMCLCAVGGICSFVAIKNLGGLLLEPNQVRDFWIVLLMPTLLLVGGTTLYIAWINQRWSKQLNAYDSDTISPHASNRFTLRELFGAMSVLAVIASLSTAWHLSHLPDYALHASRQEVPFRLPENASDISYCQGSRGFAYEFTTDEKSFTYWVESEIITTDARLDGATLSPINGPTWIFRYHHLSPYLGGPSDEIKNGLVYDWDSYPPVQAVYDRDTSRAYCFSGYPDRYR